MLETHLCIIFLVSFLGFDITFRISSFSVFWKTETISFYIFLKCFEEFFSNNNLNCVVCRKVHFYYWFSSFNRCMTLDNLLFLVLVLINFKDSKIFHPSYQIYWHNFKITIYYSLFNIYDIWIDVLCFPSWFSNMFFLCLSWSVFPQVYCFQKPNFCPFVCLIYL